MTRRTAAAGLALGAALAWAFGPVLRDLAGRWAEGSRYSFGPLVPAFAAYLLWSRRARLAGVAARPAWSGLALVAAGAAMRLAGSRYHIPWLGAGSLLPALAGVALLLGGWPALRWSWPAIAFLAFMIPLPWRLEVALGGPLQRIATEAGTYLLQAAGQPAYAEGNVIHIEDRSIGVVDACNGLGMMMMFFAFSTAAALVSGRRTLDRLVLVLSAIPIAIAANIARIAMTGLLHAVGPSRVADTFYHDVAGLVMMPLALAALWLVTVVLSYLLVEAEAAPSARAFQSRRDALLRASRGTDPKVRPDARRVS